MTTANLPFLQLQPKANEPLYRQLYQQIRQAVLAGQLDPGVRLPTSRALAKRLDLSRNTVVNAYNQLLAEGYLTAQVGAGTYVSERLPEDLSRAFEVDRHFERAKPAKQADLSERGKRYHTLGQTSAPQHPYRNPDHVFQVGLPDLESFPFDQWRRLQSRQLNKLDAWSFGYPSPLGLPELRRSLADYLKAARGVYCEPDQIIITHGSQQALSLIANILLDQGDPVWLEDPGYPGAARAFHGAGATIHCVPVDADGFCLEGVADSAPAPRIAYLTPSHQFPLGVSMPLARRLQLLQWAETEGLWLVEDDYDSEYRYQGQPLPALQGLDNAGRVIYVGTFSKVLFPGLRLGYLVAPAELVPALLAARQAQDLAPPLLAQASLAEFIDEGGYSRHIRRMRVLYSSRAHALHQALVDGLGDLLEIPEIKAGLHLSLPLPDGISDWTAAGKAIEHEVQATPLSIYCSEGQPLSGLVLGFAAARVEAIKAGGRRLSEALRPMLE